MTTAVKTPLKVFHELVDAEDYFIFLKVPYDAKIVQINRLHILKKFSNLIRDIDMEAATTESEILDHYRQALLQAYQVFQHSSSLEQKLFKVFHDQVPTVVRLSEIGSC
jgi:nitrogenase-stabilizing/protective protein